VNAAALCDAGAVGALVRVVQQRGGEARRQACGALWGLVLGGGGGQTGVDAVEGLLGGDGEEDVKAGLEGLSAGVSGSEGKQRAYVELFGVGRVVGLLGHGSAGVQAKACEAIMKLTSNCALNRVAFGEGGVVSGLVRLLGSSDSVVQQMSLQAVSDCCVSNLQNACSFCCSGAAAAICKLLQSPVAAVQEKAASCICAICVVSLQESDMPCQNAFYCAGCIPILAELFTSSSVILQQLSIRAMHCVVVSPSNSKIAAVFCDTQSMSILIDIMQTSSRETRNYVIALIWNVMTTLWRGGCGEISPFDFFNSQVGEGWEHTLESAIKGSPSSPNTSKISKLLFPASTSLHESSLLETVDVKPVKTPTFNQKHEWVDEHGCVCPKYVDFTHECSKGHRLVPFGKNLPADPAVNRLFCRICHSLRSCVDEDDHASHWVVCPIYNCCGGYAVCGDCLRVDSNASSVAVPLADAVPTLVSDNVVYCIASSHLCFAGF
jgi:hypothetical protein